jgi:hypothetical protein
MGLECGWVTDPIHELTRNQQITALGNGVLPLQAISALRSAEVPRLRAHVRADHVHTVL